MVWMKWKLKWIIINIEYDMWDLLIFNDNNK